MILMNGQSMTPKVQLFPETQQMQIGEKDSQATVTIGPDAPDIAVGDWIMEDSGPAIGITWRVRSVDTDYYSGTRTLHLEHVIQILKDTVIFGDVTAADMGGGDACTALQAVQYVLGKQGTWQLGTFGYDFSAPYEFNGDSLFDALEDICGTLADCVWTYETTRLPFTINIMPQSGAIQCEMRSGRNLSTLQKSIDRSRMYTRIYPIGADDLHITGDYIEANTDLYGVICKVQTDQAYDTEAKLRQWATDRLRRHCEPTVTVTVNGLELSAETGEPLDKLTIGTVCRIPIPELGVVMAEKITRLAWKDVIRDPADVTVTLANNREDITTLFKRDQKSAEKSSRSGAKGGAKLNNKLEDTANGLYSVMQRTADQIYMEVGNTKTELRSMIQQESDRISLVVQGTGENAKIKPASIVTAINEAGSSVTISASHITLDGRTSIGSVMSINEGRVAISRPLYVSGSHILCNDLRFHDMHVRFSDSMIESITHNTSTNTLTIKNFRGETINFKKATAISGRWSGDARGTVADFEYYTDDTSIPMATTHIYLSVSGSTVNAKDPDGNIRASIEAGSSGTSYTMHKAYDTNDNVYRGAIYDSRGNLLSGSNYYWYGCTSNIGSSGTITVRY